MDVASRQAIAWRLSFLPRRALIVALMAAWVVAGCANAPRPLAQTPTPTATASARAVPSGTPWPTPSPQVLATATGTATRSATVPPPSPSPTATATRRPTDAPTPAPTATATAAALSATVSPAAEGESILTRNQVIGDYGRGFNCCPSHATKLRKLGHTASFRDADEYLRGNDEREGILSRAARLDALNGPEVGAIPAIFLIYEGSSLRPNWAGEDFLISAPELYDYIGGVDWAAMHLDPFIPAELGQPFMIFLDHQLGYGGERPVTKAIEGMLPLLLQYPNLHFFVDPEFRVTTEQKQAIPAGQELAPGVPVGYVEAADINQAQRLIREFVEGHDLGPWRLREGGTAEVILGIHQFQDLNIGKGTPYADQRAMIVDKDRIEQVPGVTIVFDYDGVHPEGYGGARGKYERYRQVMDPMAYPGLLQWAFPAIKIFPPNPLLPSDRCDVSPFTLEELSGQQIIPDIGRFDFAGESGTLAPRVIIIT